ncbi:hypothetical protein [Elizabethkingia occulta]|uniref:hypothetical protein n=1 Tax=Elizabethkingia occulta TaxID=1867263 RepID=UPI00398C701D
MRKKLLFVPLWGIFTLSLLSSCRSEDGAIQQKQIEDNRFATFIPKSGKTINYADGFASLMKRYDNLHKTNLSGINNKPVIGTLASNDKNASLFQNGESYVESNIRSQTVTEKDDIKWVAFPKVQGNKVVSLVVGILSEKGTRVNYRTFGNGDDLYKGNVILFQAALDRRLKKTSKLALNASLNPIALADPEGCSDPYSVNYDPKCKDIEEVIITKPKPLTKEPNPSPSPPPFPTDPDGRCGDYGDCSESSGNGSGGESSPNTSDVIEFIKPKYFIFNLKRYLSCLNLNQPANLQVFAESMDNDWPGHAFISITQGSNVLTFGFYPNNPDGKISKSIISDGIMGDNSESTYTSRKNYGQISSDQLRQIVDAALVFDQRDYNISDTNCSTFAMLVMTIAGEKNPPVHPSTPNNIIRRFGNGEIKEKGKGPNTQRTCN